MRISTFTALFIVVAIYFLMAVAAEVFVDDFVKPGSLFVYILVGTVVTSLAALAVKVDIPD